MQDMVIYWLLGFVVVQGVLRYKILRIYRMFDRMNVTLNPKEMIFNKRYRSQLISHFKQYERQINQYRWSFTASVILTFAMFIFVIFALI